MSFTTKVGDIVRRAVAAWPEQVKPADLTDLLRFTARWRSQLLANTFREHHGVRIYGGPFAGMEYVGSTEGALIARLLGTYESELEPHIAAFLADGVDCVIDVGCAEGYYAVGLARRVPTATVYAYDTSERARSACATLAEKNGVADRVVIGAECKPDEFDRFAGRKALVIVDVEGAELDVLQPAKTAALAHMPIIVETHDKLRPGAKAELIARFSPTHDIEVVRQQPKTFAMPDWLQELSHLDQLLAVWEWRFAPTPWLVMRPKR